VLAATRARWRRIELDRADLDRFLFEPDDIVVALGQDGLVAEQGQSRTPETAPLTPPM
jgi:hypothetical protein